MDTQGTYIFMLQVQ